MAARKTKATTKSRGKTVAKKATRKRAAKSKTKAKRPPGKPRKIKSPEEFEKLATAYFDKCKAENKKATICGLALGLGLSTRTSLDAYLSYEGFEEVAAAAKMRVEHEYEQRLFSSSPVGAIFALKNMGWQDKQQVDVEGLEFHLNYAGEKAVGESRAKKS
jgi:hypothetical protein